MTSIGIIATGECEHRALAESLGHVFADIDVTFERSLQGPAFSITSSYLSYPGPTDGGETKVDKLVASILSILERRDAPDFILAVDDLESPNLATPHHVTQLVADAVRRYMKRRNQSASTHRKFEHLQGLPQRCSFHLLCPMLEAYFFGEPAALVRAGAVRPATLTASRHLEDFESSDLAFLGPPDGAREHRWRRPRRQWHPKQYLSFLVDPDDTGRAVYKETANGCRALATLDWSQVFRYQPPGIAFAHSLFEDLADAVGVPNPFPGESHPLTSRKVGGTLRNLA